ncbi:hypothetical protein Q5752_004429 [Cryptotrichosporon argae]
MRAFAALSLLALAAAAPTKRQSTNPPTISNCNDEGQIALTFDDGPYLYEDQINEYFNATGSKVTFFMNGNNYDCIYNHVDTIRALHASGHTIGSHTWSHADLTTLDEDGIVAELEQLETAFIRILGLRPIYFRPPYGNVNDLMYQVLAQRGYKKVFLWSDDTEDADGATVAYSENVYDQIIKSYPSTHLVLDHSPIETTIDQVIPYAVPQLLGEGYQIVAVDTCLGSDGEWPYVYVQEPGTPDSTWTC